MLNLILDTNAWIYLANGFNPVKTGYEDDGHFQMAKAPSYTDDEKQTFFERLFSEEGIDSDNAKKFLNTSGRFGTGFMTTYLLSKKISLERVWSVFKFLFCKIDHRI